MVDIIVYYIALLAMLLMRSQFQVLDLAGLPVLTALHIVIIYSFHHPLGLTTNAIPSMMILSRIVE